MSGACSTAGLNGAAEGPVASASRLLRGTQDTYALIADELQAARRVLDDTLLCDQGFICDLFGHVRQFHGKLLRPAMLLLTARACGGVRPEHIKLAAVVELVHLATLVHDDVLDESDIRRRAATVNRLWGNARAVLLGDLLYSHAFRLCSTLDSTLAAQWIGLTAIALSEGEMMQVAHRGEFLLSEAMYFDIVTRKTASLIETSCALGAHYAGADAATIERARTYGRSVGVAFQVVDDLLDLTGDEAEVGKSLGRDLDAGEMTLPLIHFLATADDVRRAAMLATIERPNEQRGRAVAAMLRNSDSLAYARDAAAGRVAAALAALDGLAPSAARDALATMAEFVLERRH